MSNLSTDERDRAAKFVFGLHKRRYVLAHVGLRQLIAEYLRCSPGEIVFRRGEFEKPYLDLDTDLRFNLSHSANLAILAVTRGSEVGVDVEYCKTDASSLPVAQLSSAEQAFLGTLPPGQAQQAFFAIWTRKEALLKGAGIGLNGELADFSALPHARRAELHSPDQRLSDIPDFESQNFVPAEGYQGAVAVRREDVNVRLFRRVFRSSAGCFSS